MKSKTNSRPEWYHSDGVGYPNTIITSAWRRILSAMLAAALLLGMVVCVPGPVKAQAAELRAGLGEVLNATATPTPTIISFGGCEWIVIGSGGDGVYSDPGTVTLLLKQDDIGPTKINEWVENSIWYEGSILQGKLEERAAVFPPDEAALILPRTLSGAADGIQGPDAENQLLWLLSKDEVELLHTDVRPYDNLQWWTRTPHPVIHGSMYTIPAGATDVGWHYAHNEASARPAVQVDVSDVLFTSAASGPDGKPTAVGSLEAAHTPAGAVKLTVAHAGQTLDAVEPEGGSGTDMPVFSYSGAAAGTGCYLSCVLEQNGAVRYYGKLASTAAAGSGMATVPLAGVPDGIYTLKIFSEQDNGDHYTDFAGGFHNFDIVISNGSAVVGSADARLLAVAGKTVTTSGGAGTASNPYKAGITLGFDMDSITHSDLAAAKGAVAELYTEGDFAVAQDTVSLSEGANQLYIKVTAQNGENQRYYQITATRNAVPDGPGVSRAELSVAVGETAGFTISLGESGNAAATADISSGNTAVATVEAGAVDQNLQTVTVTGKSKGTTVVTVAFSGGDLAQTVKETVAITVTDEDGAGPGDRDGPTSRSRSSSGSSKALTAAKAQLPASALSWDGGRTLTIDHADVTPLGLLGVQWDGVETTAYSVYAGSVIIQFDQDFIEAQEPGEHTIKAEFFNCTAQAAVTVGAAPLQDSGTNTGAYTNSNDNPSTADASGVRAALLMLGLGGAALVLCRRPRQRGRRLF